MKNTEIHAVLGALAVTVGFWLAVGSTPIEGLVAVALAVAGLLVWQGTTLGRLWAWASLLVGLDSLAWPIVTMVRIGRVTQQPDDQQMGEILGAVVTGLFAAVFWISFAWGLFRRVQRQEGEAVAPVQNKPAPKTR
ncbi:MAG: hypothetical protein ACKOBZ_00685 [Nitrospira sp.]|nr:hypothetical protein [Nitrospira sp.]